MAKFENRYGVRKIVYKQKCRCFCPIGKTDYTNELRMCTPAGSWSNLR